MDYLSTFRVPIEKIPEAKNWKVGGRYTISAQVEQTGINKERDWRTEDELVEGGKRKKGEPKYKTMVEFKVFDVAAGPKDKALKSKLKK